MSGPTIATADVLGFAWNPQGTLLWFVADRDVDGRLDLFVVDPTVDDPVPVNVSVGYASTRKVTC